MAKKVSEPKTSVTKKATLAPPAKKAQIVDRENFRGIIRIAGRDMKGELPLERALIRVRGIGHTIAKSAVLTLKSELSIDPKIQIGELNDEQIEKIDNILLNLHDHQISPFLFNRRIDYASGKNRHVIMNDLLFETTQDIERHKKNYTWKGYRHTYSQKVRGQRTRNTGRTGMAVGVLRKAVMAAQGGAAAGAAAKPVAGAQQQAAQSTATPTAAGGAKTEKKPSAPTLEKK